jgi:lipid-A-disaccharide synthase
MKPRKAPRIAIVANEPSGDLLGAGLMRGLRQLHPEVRFEGVGGARMEAEGLTSLVPLERLSVMGLVEVIRHLPELLRIRRQLIERFLGAPPDLFIGIDAPDFNLGLEQRLRKGGIPTAHYVCPSVWAWRTGRVKKIRAAADLVLCLFPFEPDFLARHGVQARFVGHTLADAIPSDYDPQQARERLQLKGADPAAPMLALLPGSRSSEVQALAGPFLETASLCQRTIGGLEILVPLVNQRVRDAFQAAVREGGHDGLKIHLIDGHARDAIAASDAVLTASGTATLETLLLRKPMVVGYRLNPLTYWIVDTFKLVKVPFVSIANLLAEREIVPEFIQHRLIPRDMAKPLIQWLTAPETGAEIRKEAKRIHHLLSQDTDLQAAKAVTSLLAPDSSR